MSQALALKIKQHKLLTDKAAQLRQITNNFEDGFYNATQTSKQLLALVETTKSEEHKMMSAFGMKDKVTFVSTQLENMVEKLKLMFKSIYANSEEKSQSSRDIIAQDERLVYVYLFNVQGQSLRSWRAQLAPGVFKECGVHRPVYSDPSHIENVILRKSDKTQHAYVAVKVKKSDVQEGAVKDELGYPLVRLKYGVLSSENIISLTTSESQYQFGCGGELKLLA